MTQSRLWLHSNCCVKCCVDWCVDYCVEQRVAKRPWSVSSGQMGETSSSSLAAATTRIDCRPWAAQAALRWNGWMDVWTLRRNAVTHTDAIKLCSGTGRKWSGEVFSQSTGTFMGPVGLSSRSTGTFAVIWLFFIIIIYYSYILTLLFSQGIFLSLYFLKLNFFHC